MGYTTNFEGRLTLSKPLSIEKMEYINRLSGTRRMKRDVNKLMELYGGKYGYPNRKSKDPVKIYGIDGEYFAKDDRNFGQTRDSSIIDYNDSQQPGLWCQWIIVEDNGQQYLEWDEGEKFYNYIDWLKYLNKHFFKPWKIKLNGKIMWDGEERGDIGKIVVKDGNIEIYEDGFKIK
jgi:hypothetical protein